MSYKNLWYVLLAAALVCSVVPLHAATIHVSTTGVDTNPATCGGGLCCGIPSQPCATIQGGYDHAADGDRVLVAPGTYNECVSAFDSLGDKAVDIVAADWENDADNTTTIIDGTPPCLPSVPGTEPKSPAISIGSIAGSRLEGFTVMIVRRSGIEGFGSVTFSLYVVKDKTSIEGGVIFDY